MASTRNKRSKSIVNSIEVPASKGFIPSPYVGNADNPKLVFSFELYDKNEYFGVNPTCDGWTIRLFDELKEYSRLTLRDIENNSKALRFHSLKSASDCPCNPPNRISLDDMEQIEIGSRRNGRMHFVRSGNIIYVVWFDPLHNAYPTKGVRKLD